MVWAGFSRGRRGTVEAFERLRVYAPVSSRLKTDGHVVVWRRRGVPRIKGLEIPLLLGFSLTEFGLSSVFPRIPPHPTSPRCVKDAGLFRVNAMLSMAEAARELEDPGWALQLHSAASRAGLVSRQMWQVVVKVLIKAGRLEAAARVLQVKMCPPSLHFSFLIRFSFSFSLVCVTFGAASFWCSSL